MDTQPSQTQHQTDTDSQQAQPRDLTWLGMADDRELVCRAREIAAQNTLGSPAAKASDGMAAKLHSWQLAEG